MEKGFAKSMINSLPQKLQASPTLERPAVVIILKPPNSYLGGV